MRYSRDWLIHQIDAGATFKFLHFWGHKPQPGAEVGHWFFSQWFPSDFEVEGRHYRTAEHWMMAEKARIFGDEEAFEDVFIAESPGEAKKIGRRVRNFDPAVWSAACSEIVVQGNLHKFGQNPTMGNYLLQTGKQVLVEASPRDRIWGIGMGKNNENANDPTQWRGKNLLGFALMETRDRMSAKN